MLYEQEISFIINLNEIIRGLSQQKNEIYFEDNIIINYFGDRKDLKKNIKFKRKKFI